MTNAGLPIGRSLKANTLKNMADFAKAPPAKHKPVLLQEVVEGLRLKSGEVFVDATYGAGGHTKEILKQSPGVEAISIDRDPKVPANITGNFRDIDELLGST